MPPQPPALQTLFSVGAAAGGAAGAVVVGLLSTIGRYGRITGLTSVFLGFFFSLPRLSRLPILFSFSAERAPNSLSTLYCGSPLLSNRSRLPTRFLVRLPPPCPRCIQTGPRSIQTLRFLPQISTDEIVDATRALRVT